MVHKVGHHVLVDIMHIMRGYYDIMSPHSPSPSSQRSVTRAFSAYMDKLCQHILVSFFAEHLIINIPIYSIFLHPTLSITSLSVVLCFMLYGSVSSRSKDIANMTRLYFSI